MNKKNVFVVLGMARSGTSVISRGLKAIGIDLGNKFTPSVKSPWNPKGSWEDTEIVYKVNEKVFAALGYRWDTVQLIDSKEQQLAVLQKFKTVAKSLLQERFSAVDYWGFKDPRTAKILRFWQSVFEEMQIEDHYIIVLRNPLGSAESYQRLTGADIEHGLLLWLTHLLPAILHTTGKRRTIISYELLMANPKRELERLKTQLHIPIAADSKEIDEYINSFLDKNLLHHEFSSADLQSHLAVGIAPLCIRLFDWLLKIAKDEARFEDPLFLADFEAIENEFTKFMPLYNYIDRLLQQNKQHQKYIQSLHKSRLWKMIAPLRQVDDALRSYRKRLKTHE